MQNNVVLFYGPNAFLLEQTLKQWTKVFMEKYINGELNLERLDGSTTNANEILEKCSTLPFLSEKRLIIVKNFLNEANTEQQKKIAESISLIPDCTILIFEERKDPDKRTSLFKKLSKECRVEYFEELKDLALTEWIINEAKKNGSFISANTANYLTMYSGTDCLKLNNELKKLSLYKPNLEITKEDIEKLCTEMLQTSIFKLTDLIGCKKYKEALLTLEKIIQSGEELPMIFHMLIRQFRLIYLIKNLKSQGSNPKEIASQLKQHPFVVSNIFKQCDNYSLTELETIHTKLLEIETNFKTGKIYITSDDKRDFVLALERLLFNT